jgi:hypothetical protein
LREYRITIKRIYGPTSRVNSQVAGGQSAQERQPPGVVFGAGDVQAKEFPVAVGVDAGGDQGMDVDSVAV